MNINKLLLLNVYTLSVLVVGVSSLKGAELPEPTLKGHRSEDYQVVAATVVDLHTESPESRRSGSSHMSEYEGKYVLSDRKGVVTIKQPRYPSYTGNQNLWIEPKAITPIMIDESNDMPYQIVSYEEADGPLDPTSIETIVDDSIEPFTIIGSEQVGDKPYSSCGRLTMAFPKSKEYKDGAEATRYFGSGAAIDKNIVITAAHNLLPPRFNNHPNVDRVRAETVKFEHMLIAARVSTQGPVAAAKVSTHCFVHPEWEKDFNPRYDVALIFLSESLNLTQGEIDKLMKLKILNGKEERIRVVGHPKGWVDMRESEGETSWEQALESQDIIYHFANTLPGSSGSPIIADSQYIIGTHTRGAFEGSSGANSGIRMRRELIPFIENSIEKHQAFLDSVDALEKLRAQEKQRQEQALVDKGEKTKTIEIARNLKSMNLTIEQIKTATGLSEEEINAIQ
jgi:V8-like Glu-specific endopeptidase